MQYQPHMKSTLDESDQPAVFAPLCKSIIAARAAAAGMFGSLCSDPGSEMLLDLYWRDSQGLKTSITSLWFASKASEMTARRCLAVMEEQGIVERVPDASDKRRINIRLTPAGREKMDTCFRTLMTGYAETCQDCARNCDDEPSSQDYSPWKGIPFCIAVGGMFATSATCSCKASAQQGAS